MNNEESRSLYVAYGKTGDTVVVYDMITIDHSGHWDKVLIAAKFTLKPKGITVRELFLTCCYKSNQKAKEIMAQTKNS